MATTSITCTKPPSVLCAAALVGRGGLPASPPLATLLPLAAPCMPSAVVRLPLARGVSAAPAAPPASAAALAATPSAVVVSHSGPMGLLGDLQRGALPVEHPPCVERGPQGCRLLPATQLSERVREAHSSEPFHGPAEAPVGLLGGELGGDGAHGAQVGPQPLAGLPPCCRPLRQPLLWRGIEALETFECRTSAAVYSGQDDRHLCALVLNKPTTAVA